MSAPPDVPLSALHVGIDENGLGPRLGPLIVTAVAARISGGGARVVTHAPRGALAGRIGDSKKLVSFGDSVLGEAWARILAPHTVGVAEASSPDDVIAALSIDARDVLEKPCPTEHKAQCWATDTEGFVAEPPLVAQLRGDLGRLEKKGVQVLGAHVVIVCTERLNDAVVRGVSRFQADLHAMERLLLHVRHGHGEEIDATCGKVGGYDSYPRAFGPLSGHLHTTLEEGRARSAYRISNLGQIAFVRDADSGHMLVSLASLVGKWVRDLLTRRVTRYHRAHDATLPEASGYHDPITTRFVTASALSRKQRGVPDDCFERRSRKNA